MALTYPPSALLMAGAVLVHQRKYNTACDAISSLLPKSEVGNEAFWRAKDWLRPFIPDQFETRRGWWRDREPRVLGMLLASHMAASHLE